MRPKRIMFNAGSRWASILPAVAIPAGSWLSLVVALCYFAYGSCSHGILGMYSVYMCV